VSGIKGGIGPSLYPPGEIQGVEEVELPFTLSETRERVLLRGPDYTWDYEARRVHTTK